MDYTLNVTLLLNKRFREIGKLSSEEQNLNVLEFYFFFVHKKIIPYNVTKDNDYQYYRRFLDMSSSKDGLKIKVAVN